MVGAVVVKDAVAVAVGIAGKLLIVMQQGALGRGALCLLLTDSNFVDVYLFLTYPQASDLFGCAILGSEFETYLNFNSAENSRVPMPVAKRLSQEACVDRAIYLDL